MFLALGLPVLAQDAAQTSGRIQESLNRRALQEQVSDRRTGPALPEGFKTDEDKADETAPTAEERKPILPLKRLEFGATRVLPESLLTELRGRYEGRTVSIADIKAIAAAVNKYYREHGYLTSRAYLPEQDVSKGTLRVELMEGTIGKVDATGLTTTKPEYVRRAAGIKPGETGTIYVTGYNNCLESEDPETVTFAFQTPAKLRRGGLCTRYYLKYRRLPPSPKASA